MRAYLMVALMATWLGASAATAATRDGQRFDQGATMTEPADRASEAFHAVRTLVGDWDVVHDTMVDGEVAHTGQGVAEITFMNRGHGLIERFHTDDVDGQGQSLDTITFVTHVPSNDVWCWGVANSVTESVTLHTGGLEGKDLVVQTVGRRGGRQTLTHTLVSLHSIEDDSFSIRIQEGSWPGELATIRRMVYTRRSAAADFFASNSPYGEAAELPDEAHQFDFLLGEWNLAHELTLGSGQVVNFPVNGTAVRALNGHAIMEHAWYDVDPTVPDAATTIVRLYNRAMRRWESMYTTNRFNGILHFGGVKEGDDIVLHSFESNTSVSPFSYWIFHDMQEDSYGWYANTSKDRGATFAKTWIIQAQRK